MTTIHAIPQYDIGSDASRLVSALRRAVVEIRSPAGGGAGIVWGGAGLVVTNAHCVRKNGSLTIEMNGERHSAELIAFARDHDLALIHAPSVSGPLLELRDVDTLRPGELVFAYGHPLGVSHSLAMGALHGVVRDKRTGTPRFIAADIRLAPGNSGGPLVDAEGKLVGVNSMIVGGLGVAIPASVVQAFVTRATSVRAA
jgi:serine protease Do